MPQASQTLRENIIRRFGDLDTRGPIAFLANAGYSIDENFFIVTDKNRALTADEEECVRFLIDEWDFSWRDF